MTTNRSTHRQLHPTRVAFFAEEPAGLGAARDQEVRVFVIGHRLPEGPGRIAGRGSQGCFIVEGWPHARPEVIPRLRVDAYSPPSAHHDRAGLHSYRSPDVVDQGCGAEGGGRAHGLLE